MNSETILMLNSQCVSLFRVSSMGIQFFFIYHSSRFGADDVTLFGRIQGVTAIIGPGNPRLTGTRHTFLFSTCWLLASIIKEETSHIWNHQNDEGKGNMKYVYTYVTWHGA